MIPGTQLKAYQEKLRASRERAVGAVIEKNTPKPPPAPTPPTLREAVTRSAKWIHDAISRTNSDFLSDAGPSDSTRVDLRRRFERAPNVLKEALRAQSGVSLQDLLVTCTVLADEYILESPEKAAALLYWGARSV